MLPSTSQTSISVRVNPTSSTVSIQNITSISITYLPSSSVFSSIHQTSRQPHNQSPFPPSHTPHNVCFLPHHLCPRGNRVYRPQHATTHPERDSRLELKVRSCFHPYRHCNSKGIPQGRFRCCQPILKDILQGRLRLHQSNFISQA